jgi:hypothetical protein
MLLLLLLLLFAALHIAADLTWPANIATRHSQDVCWCGELLQACANDKCACWSSKQLF